MVTIATSGVHVGRSIPRPAAIRGVERAGTLSSGASGVTMPATSPAAIRMRNRRAFDPAFVERERERQREYQRNKRVTDPAAYRDYQREWQRNRRATDPAYVERGRECQREYHAKRGRKRNRTLKIEALNAYGGARCVHCGETNLKALQLDHVNDNGKEHRLALTGSARLGGWPFYRKLKALGWPNDPPLQVLCDFDNQDKRVSDLCNRAKGNQL